MEEAMTPITTTLAAIREHSPCEDGREKLLKYLGRIFADNEPFSLAVVLDSNGFDDAIWCLRALGQEHHRMIVALACDFAERALPMVPADEDRPRLAIETTRRWLRGEATLDEVHAARDASGHARDASGHARAARAAASAAYLAAYLAARDASDAGRDASAAAAWTARAVAAWAASDAASDAWAAEREWQAARLRQYLDGEIEV